MEWCSCENMACSLWGKLSLVNYRAQWALRVVAKNINTNTKYKYSFFVKLNQVKIRFMKVALVDKSARVSNAGNIIIKHIESVRWWSTCEMELWEHWLYRISSLHWFFFLLLLFLFVWIFWHLNWSRLKVAGVDEEVSSHDSWKREKKNLWICQLKGSL